MKKYNIIFIVLDGFRVGRLKLSNELNEIIKKGLFFSNMIVSGPYSLISLYSLFSGMYGSKNGLDAYFNMKNFRKDKCKTFMKYLKEEEYYNRAEVIVPDVVLDKDFDKVTIDKKPVHDTTNSHIKIIKEMAELNKQGKNFFLFLLYSDLYSSTFTNVIKKYDDFSPEFFNDKEKHIERYNDCVKQAGIYSKKMLETIENENLSENTIVIFSADHGTSNGERIGEKAYGSYLYNYTIKSFAIIINKKLFPNPEEISAITRNIDIMPTLMETLDIDIDHNYETMQGKSLIPIINKTEKQNRIAYCETGGLNGPYPSPRAPNVKCVITDNWKLIHNLTPDTWELYNLEQDPEETDNLTGKHPDIENNLKEELKRVIEDCKIKD